MKTIVSAYVKTDIGQKVRDLAQQHDRSMSDIAGRLLRLAVESQQVRQQLARELKEEKQADRKAA